MRYFRKHIFYGLGYVMAPGFLICLLIGIAYGHFEGVDIRYHYDDEATNCHHHVYVDGKTDEYNLEDTNSDAGGTKAGIRNDRRKPPRVRETGQPPQPEQPEPEKVSPEVEPTPVVKPDPPMVQPPIIPEVVLKTAPPVSVDERPIVGRVVPQVSTPVLSAMDIVLTEIMYRDWSRTGGGGKPQWFELYNAGTGRGTIDGWSIIFDAVGPVGMSKGRDAVRVVFRSLTIEPGKALVVSRKAVFDRPWLRNIENVYVETKLLNLKNKWKLIDANGKVIYHRRGHWSHNIGGHTKEGYRKSVAILPTELPVEGETYFYGVRTDVGTPGYHKEIAPAAPALYRPKLVTVWGALKQ